jgi:hypothetical protein
MKRDGDGSTGWSAAGVWATFRREQLLAASVPGRRRNSQLFIHSQSDEGFQQILKQEPWGARTFIVRDPDGNLLLFAGPAA